MSYIRFKEHKPPVTFMILLYSTWYIKRIKDGEYVYVCVFHLFIINFIDNDFSFVCDIRFSEHEHKTTNYIIYTENTIPFTNTVRFLSYCSNEIKVQSYWCFTKRSIFILFIVYNVQMTLINVNWFIYICIQTIIIGPLTLICILNQNKDVRWCLLMQKNAVFLFASADSN